MRFSLPVPVFFTLPPGAVGGTVEIRSETSNELLLWEVLKRPDQPDWSFIPLPSEADDVTPFLPGRTYTLTVSAWFGVIDIDSPDPWGDFVAYAQSIGPIEGGVTQITRRSIQITTN